MEQDSATLAEEYDLLLHLRSAARTVDTSGGITSKDKLCLTDDVIFADGAPSNSGYFDVRRHYEDFGRLASKRVRSANQRFSSSRLSSSIPPRPSLFQCASARAMCRAMLRRRLARSSTSFSSITSSSTMSEQHAQQRPCFANSYPHSTV